MKKSNTLVKICNIVCAVVIIAMLAVMCLPYWGYTAVEIVDRREWNEEKEKYDYFEDEIKTDENASIMELTWLSFEHESLTDNFIKEDLKAFLEAGGRRRDHNEGEVLNALVAMPFLVTLLSVFGVVFCLWKNKSTWTSLFPAIAGFLAVQTLLTNADYKAGDSYTITLVTAFVLLVVGVVLLVQMVMGLAKWFFAKK